MLVKPVLSKNPAAVRVPHGPSWRRHDEPRVPDDIKRPNNGYVLCALRPPLSRGLSLLTNIELSTRGGREARTPQNEHSSWKMGNGGMGKMVISQDLINGKKKHFFFKCVVCVKNLR